jgi:pimeloyl-ACP methyl ester carboxylesterase
MFSETRYAMNGDLRVAYRASREGPRDIVFVPNWFTCCELFPELPSTQGWVEAMTSLGRLIFFDQPGTGASDPVTAGALPTLEQWADSITAVLDALGSPEAALVTHPGALPTAALFAATHPSRTTALVLLESATNGADRTKLIQEEVIDGIAATWGTGEIQHLLNPDMPWNEEIRATWAREERLAASPRTVELMLPLITEVSALAILPTVRVPTLVLHYSDDPFVPPEMGKDVADHIEGAKFVELPGRNLYHFVEPWRESFQEIAEFLTGSQAEVADDRVLATVLFTDIVDSTRRAADMGDPARCATSSSGQDSSSWSAALRAQGRARRMAPLRRPFFIVTWTAKIVVLHCNSQRQRAAALALAEPDDISAAVVWLASDFARTVTGTQLIVDMGATKV